MTQVNSMPAAREKLKLIMKYYIGDLFFICPLIIPLCSVRLAKRSITSRNHFLYIKVNYKLLKCKCSNRVSNLTVQIKCQVSKAK